MSRLGKLPHFLPSLGCVLAGMISGYIILGSFILVSPPLDLYISPSDSLPESISNFSKLSNISISRKISIQLEGHHPTPPHTNHYPSSLYPKIGLTSNYQLTIANTFIHHESQFRPIYHLQTLIMFSCVNYERGCRGRSNQNQARCSDCVTLNLSAGRSGSASSSTSTPSSYSAMSGAFASLASLQTQGS